MILWRVSNHLPLDGGGGLRASGRWHSVGRRVVYCAPNPASALLEVLVHAGLDFDELPIHLQYLELEAPDTLSMETVAPDVLVEGWENNVGRTRRAGDEWLGTVRSALFGFPR